MFLRSAGMPLRTVRAIAEGLDAEGLTARQRALVAFSQKITASPGHFAAEDTQKLQRALGSESDLLEAANVTAAFNFANRCADALGAKQEVPSIFQGSPRIRWVVMAILSSVIRMRMTFENRRPKSVSTDEILDRLQADMAQAGMGKLPPFFGRLRPRPDLVAVQAMATRVVLLENQLSSEINLRLAYLISVINGDREWAHETACGLIACGVRLQPLDELAQGGCPPLLPLDREMLLFAREHHPACGSNHR